jgi:hypothetical protein
LAERSNIFQGQPRCECDEVRKNSRQILTQVFKARNSRYFHSVLFAATIQTLLCLRRRGKIEKGNWQQHNRQICFRNALKTFVSVRLKDLDAFSAIQRRTKQQTAQKAS